MPAAGTTIKTLKKPTLPAWLSNQLVRAEPDQVDELIQRGEQLREAHLSQDGARLRDLTPRRRDLVRDLVKAARAHAKEHGPKVTDDVAERPRRSTRPWSTPAPRSCCVPGG